MDISKGTLDKLAEMMGDMEGKPEDELIDELAIMIKSGQGGLTPKKAKQMIHTIMPMLSGGQKRKLEKLLRALNR